MLARPGIVVASSYLAGAVPFSNLAAHRVKGVDLRQVGTGTVSGTALFEVAGFGPLALAGVLDVAKGAIGPLLAGRRRPVLAAVAGGAAVAGHNWSVFLGGAGGRGISPAMGALLAQAWPGTAVLVAGLAGGRLAHHTALASLAADVLLVPVAARTNGRVGAMAGAAVLVPMLAKRITGNGLPPRPRPVGWWRSRLLYDRDPA